jgi:molybdopterin synthase sulfur carrier subunit
MIVTRSFRVSVSFYLTPALRAYADGRERIEIGGSPATLGDALEALWTLCPGLRHRVATEQGEIREHVNVFVEQENVRYTGGLATQVPDGAEISIFHAVSGGACPAP